LIAAMQLVEPALEYLTSYAAALATGWSPNNVTNVSAEQLAAIERDPAGFIASVVAQGGNIRLPDGTIVQKLPFIVRWMWDGDFCGSISMRWQPGTDALPPQSLGHIGYAVVPWKRGRGYASDALRVILIEARSVGLSQVEITTDPDNRASQRVIERNGGTFVESFVNEHYGPAPHLRYVVNLSSAETPDRTP
jgi:predicted acetyltransferase